MAHAGQYILLMVIITLFIKVRSVPVDFTLELIKSVKLEILQHEKQCTNLVTVYDIDLPLLAESSSRINNQWNGETVMVASLVSKGTNFTSEHLTIREPEPIRLYRPCSLVLVDATEAYKRDENITTWPLSFKQFPGHPHQIYHLFFLRLENDSVEDFLLDFASTAVKLQHAFFALSYSNGEIVLYTRNLGFSSWYVSSTYKPGAEGPFLHEEKSNFGGATALAMVCAVCQRALEDFKSTGTWRDFLAATKYELVTSLNGSLEMQPVFTLPNTGLNEDGEWDEFVKPTLNGEAVFAALLKPSAHNRHAVYLSEPMFFDSTAFITARPKRIYYSSLGKLYEPLTTAVWIGTCVSVIVMVIAVETIIHAKRGLTEVPIFPKKWTRALASVVIRRLGHPYLCPKKSLLESQHEHSHTIHAVVDPLLDQSGLRSRVFQENINHGTTRLLVGMWFLLVIVLSQAYKSMMTSLIVKPRYKSPPTTFAELIESDYDIGCVFFEDNIELDFLALNNSLSREILRRVLPYDYFIPRCYQKVFETNSVCIGYRRVFDLLGIEYTVDIKYQKMAVMSKESLFPLTVGVGVSMLYPALIEPFNWYVQWLRDSGIYEKWERNGLWAQLKTGQVNARSFIKTKSYYGGQEEDPSLSVYETVTILAKIIMYGAGAGTIVFCIEIIVTRGNKILKWF